MAIPIYATRHYKHLAKFLAREIAIGRDVGDVDRALVLEGFTRLLATELTNDNPSFNRAKFLAEANVPETGTSVRNRGKME